MADIQMIPISKIGYSQDSIGIRFRDGGLVSTMIRDLKSRTLDIHSIPAICVYQTKRGNFFSHDNRRLYAMKEAGFRHIPCIITSDHVPASKFTRQQGASTIVVRGREQNDDSTPGLPYTCHTCKREFRYMSLLKKHMKCNHPDLTFTCRHCRSGFSLEFHLKKHMMQAHPDLSHICRECQRGYPEMLTLEQHMKGAHPELKYICVLCQRGFHKFTNLTKHLMMVHTDLLYTCGLCMKGFREFTNLTKHIMEPHPDVQYNCRYCTRVFPLMFSLEKHIKSAHPDLPYMCRLCQRGFPEMLTLEQHMKGAHPELKYICGEYMRGFPIIVSFEQHLKSAHPQSQSACEVRQPIPVDRSDQDKDESAPNLPYACQECQRGFRKFTSLTKHMMEAHPDLPYICRQCQRGFPEMLTLEQHMKGAHPELKYICGECKRGFPVMSSLEDHIKSAHPQSQSAYEVLHPIPVDRSNQEKDESAPDLPYPCHECKRKFRQILSLEQHIKSAHPQSQSACEVLQPIPVDRSDQEKEDTAPDLMHTCHECKRKFREMSSLKNHIKSTHPQSQSACEVLQPTPVDRSNQVKDDTAPDLMHTCHECKKEFRQMSSLKNHVKSEHLDLRYICRHCARGFCQMPSLEQHTMEAHPDLLHTCGECMRDFSFISSLQQHKKDAHPDFRYTCGVCMKGFRQMSSLEQHMMEAHPDLPYICRDCMRGYPQIWCLKKHLKNAHPQSQSAREVLQTIPVDRSDQEKVDAAANLPYTCDYCRVGFRQMSGLIQHEKDGYPQSLCAPELLPPEPVDHSDGEQDDSAYTCRKCGIDFHQIPSLMQHEKTQHPQSRFSLG